MKFIFSSFLLIFLLSCGKDTGFVHHSQPVPRQFFADSYSIHEIDSGNKVDILWVVDNSGSMGTIQKNIVKNAELFMKGFVKSNYIDWKMGLVSTDEDDAPYLGFSSLFDRKTPNPVDLFRDSVNSLGTDGSASEYVFHNIYRALNLSVTTPFHRVGAHLAVIMVTDEEEQSLEVDRSLYQVTNFYNVMLGMVTPRYKMRIYGAINAKELENCSEYAMEFAGSPFEKIISMTNGFVVSACRTNFGDGLAEIGKDIASLLSYPRLFLSERPRIDTLRVIYKGKELLPGRPDEGGYWFYDDEFNMIVFYDLNFSQDFSFDSVDVKFEINDGEIRD